MPILKNMGSLKLIACSLLVLLSAYLAASEVALFSLSRFQLRFIKENFRGTYRRVKHLLGDTTGLLTTILIINELLNICISTLLTDVLSQEQIQKSTFFHDFPDWVIHAFLGLICTTPVLLIFCEVTPKVVAVKMNQIVAIMTVRPLTAIYHVLKPVRYILKRISFWIASWVYSKWRVQTKWVDPSSESLLKEADFLSLLEEGKKEGAIQNREFELIRSVLELDHTLVEEIATPLTQVLSLPVQTPLAEAWIVMRTDQCSRIPITGKNKKDIIGILYSRDLLQAKLKPDPTSMTIAELMRKPFFVESKMKLSKFFRKLKQQKTHIAIVKNEEGEAVGLVTMSDFLEVLFDDFFSVATQEKIS